MPTVITKNQFLYDFFLKDKENNKKLVCRIFDPTHFKALSFYHKINSIKSHTVFVWVNDSDEVYETMLPDMLHNNISKTGIVWWDGSILLEITYVTRSYQSMSYGSFDYNATVLTLEHKKQFINIITDHITNKLRKITNELNEELGV